jgi:hypothetical protein
MYRLDDDGVTPPRLAVRDEGAGRRRAVPMEKPQARVEGRTRKARAGKATSLAGPAAVSKVKSTIHLTLEASQRLDVHCSMTRIDRSAMVEKLINEHLRRYVVQDRGSAAPAVVPFPEMDGEAAARSA